MSKIGDLIVKLKLDGDDYKKGLKTAGKETQTFGSGIGKIFGKGGLKMIAGWGAAIAAAVKVGVKAYKDLASRSQAMYDNMQRRTEALKGVWEELKDRMVGTRADGLIDSLKTAGRLAKELYNAMDAIGEITTGRNIYLAKNATRINELKENLANPGLSKSDRLAAGNELLNIYRQAESSLTKGLGEVQDKVIEKYMQKMGVNLKKKTASEVEDLKRMYINFFMWLGSEQGQAMYSYYTKRADLADSQIAQNGVYQQLQRKSLIGTSNLTQKENLYYASWLSAYDKGINDKSRAEIEKAIVGYAQQEAAFSEETLRIKKQINTVENMREDTPPPTPKDLPRTWDKIVGAGGSLPVLQGLAEGSSGSIAGMEEWWKAQGDAAEEYVARMQHLADLMESISADFQNACISGISDSIQYMTDVMFGLEDMNVGALFQKLLEPLADFAMKSGEIIMAEGAGMLAAKMALTNPYTAIAAGAALVAVGAAAKSGLQALSNSFAKGGTATSTASTSASSVDTNISTELTVYVKGRISGSDIVISGDRTVKAWGR